MAQDQSVAWGLVLGVCVDMKRLTLFLGFLFGLLVAVAGVVVLPTGSVCEAAPQVLWEKSRVGKLSAELLLAPNGNLLLPLGSQLKSVSPDGKELWNFKVPGGGAGRLAISKAGAIFYPSSSSVQEIKVNGARGWRFSVFEAGRKSKGAMVAWGSSGHIYLPLVSGMYILDQAGCCVAKLSPWESRDRQMTKLPTYFNVLSAIADETACYVVYSDDKAGYWIAAVNNQGQLFWRYWLGDLKDAYLLQGTDGTVYAVTSLKKGRKGKSKDKGKVYAFDSRDGREPLWKTAINCDRIAGSALSTETLYLTAEDHIYALDIRNGKIVWDKRFLDVVSPPAVDPRSGYLYIGCSDGRLIAVDQRARMCWSLPLEGAITHAPLITPGGYLYVATDKSKLYKIAPAEVERM